MVDPFAANLLADLSRIEATTFEVRIALTLSLGKPMWTIRVIDHATRRDFCGARSHDLAEALVLARRQIPDACKARGFVFPQTAQIPIA